MSSGLRLGILGGTFDPIHVGHVVAGAAVLHDLALDRVLLVVANQPWQKVGLRNVTPAADRYAMVEAAVADVAGLEASALELERGGPSYTADTVAALADRHPGAELFLVVGADLVSELAGWERIEEVRAGVTLVVVTRPGARRDEPAGDWRWQAVTIPALDISSSDLRDRVASGRPIDGLVPPATVRYIAQRRLYAG